MQEGEEMNKYEYIVMKDVNVEQLEDALNKAGEDGFKLSWMKPTDLADSAFMLVLQRKIARNA